MIDDDIAIGNVRVFDEFRFPVGNQHTRAHDHALQSGIEIVQSDVDRANGLAEATVIKQASATQAGYDISEACDSFALEWFERGGEGEAHF